MIWSDDVANGHTTVGPAGNYFGALDTAEDSMAVVAAKIAELVAV
jgi:hypothetical protein